MEQTFEQMKDAAKEVHRRFYKYCTSSFNAIVNTDNVRDLRRVVIRYRDYVSDPRAAHYIRENYADVLEALGLRIQFYIDGRVRLYLANLYPRLWNGTTTPLIKTRPLGRLAAAASWRPGTPRIAIGASSTTNASCAMRSWRRTSATGGYRCGSPSGSDVYMTRSICPPVSKARAGSAGRRRNEIFHFNHKNTI